METYRQTAVMLLAAVPLQTGLVVLLVVASVVLADRVVLAVMAVLLKSLEVQGRYPLRMRLLS
jgi:hypothetical protein